MSSRQDKKKEYKMISNSGRNERIEEIDSGKRKPPTKQGIKERYWEEGKKHHPKAEIPTRIYLLGNGTIKELYKRYCNIYGNIDWKSFIGFTRELIKQKIMI